MSLRTRLVLIVLTVVTLGLVASGIATSALLRSYLVDRVDTQLDTTSAVAERLLERGAPTTGTPGIPPPANEQKVDNSFEIQAARFRADNQLATTLQGPFSKPSAAFQSIPASVLADARNGGQPRFEVETDSGLYRGKAVAIAATSDVVVVISSMRGVEATMSRLYWIAAIGTLVLLVAAGAAAFLLVRVGLRPLRTMADTADRIAGGHSSVRIPNKGNTEVARLSRAINSAFDAQAASEQTLRQFLADASHELRTPLTSIRGYAELLRAGALSEPCEQNQAIARIESEGARMGMLVDDLLSLAHLDEVRELTFSEVDLTEITRDAVNDFRTVEPGRSVSLVAREPVLVSGDQAALRQLLANLLGNVRRHAGVDASVEVGVCRTSAGARIDIVDDGPGIPTEDHDRVFDRFWCRASKSSSTASSGSGTGLGLAIVAAIAQAHDGQARVVSSPGRGAHFVVELPRASRRTREARHQRTSDRHVNSQAVHNNA